MTDDPATTLDADDPPEDAYDEAAIVALIEDATRDLEAAHEWAAASAPEDKRWMP